ncbi:hypothetical protein Tco_0010017 [Tanacetum coccineum]
MLTDQIDWTNPEGKQVRIDISKPLPLSGPPGHVTIQTQFFFNKDLDYLRYGSKGSRLALSISKMKAAHYLDFGLELLVPEDIWINKVCTYDISAYYGISHWWFNRQKFYIDRHIVESSRKVVKTHMRIRSVVSIKAYSRYGYDYLKEITLHRADYQEYKIAEKDFKNMYPNDFEDLNLLLLQGHFNHLSGSDRHMLSTAVNLWTRNLDAKGYEYKHDYTIIDSPCIVVFPVSNNERKTMRFNEIYKFSDGMLTNIMEALDYRVKEYTVNRLNPGINTRFCTDKDVERILPQHPSDTYVFTMKMEILLELTSNKLMVSIKRTRKLGDSDVHTLEDPTLILEILSRRFFLRLNLPNHRSVLTGSEVQVKTEMEIPHSSGVHLITACSYSIDTSKDLMKAQVYVSKLPQL